MTVPSSQTWRGLERWPGQVAAGLGMAAIAVGLRFLMDPLLGDRQPYTPAFGAVAIAVWFAGWRAAAVTTVACHVAANYFFISPRYQWHFDAQEVVGAGSYYVIAATIIYLGHRARTAIDALRRADEEKDRFIATLSHELRNPMAPIANATKLLQRGAALDPAFERAVAILARQTAHMRRLLDDLLDVSRINRERLALRRERVDLRAVIEHAVETAHPPGTDEWRPISVRVPQGPLTIEADATRLTQALGNILNNAIKYTPAGTPISVEVLPEAAEIVIAVRDQGPGIATDVMPGLFKAFTKTAERGADAPGLGIGLWLANRLVELHGGRIEVRSRRGEGAEFLVRLPR